jgi:hypothetical protein
MVGSRRRRRLIGSIAIVALALRPSPRRNEHRSRGVAREFRREHPCPSTDLPTGGITSYRSPAAGPTPSERDRLIDPAGHCRGLRVSELISLTWRQLCLDAGRLQVWRVKGGENGQHPISGRRSAVCANCGGSSRSVLVMYL